MSERYNILFSLPDNLCLENFPFVISAGKLLLDNTSGKTLAQLKIKNLSSKTVSALKISITCYDVAKRVLGEKLEYTYLDLNALPNTEFGQKTPVFLTSSETRSYDVNFVEAVYNDGTVVTAQDKPLVSIPVPDSLAILGSELAEEYKLIHGEKCKYVPKIHENVWICSCGAINSEESDCCSACQNNKDKLFENANKDVLTSLRSERLAIEKELAEKAKVQKEQTAKRNKKIALIATPIACVLVVFLILWINVIQPNMKYNKALDLMKAEKYEEAIAAFEAMDGYKDSDMQVLECDYRKAMELLNDGNYADAYELFVSLAGYKDSQDIALSFRNFFVQKGDHVFLGTYHQNKNHSDNEPKEIEWTVLDKKDDSILVISNFILDRIEYYNYADVQNWLNEDFLNTAFSLEEKERLLETSEGKVFLLSTEEAIKHFPTCEERMCSATDYLLQKTNSSHNPQSWDTRTVLFEDEDFFILNFVDSDGYVYGCECYHRPLYETAVEIGNGPYTANIRPAMWIKTK